MIIKSFEINKVELDKNKFILFYGKNEGFKSEVLKVLIKEKSKILNYEEKEILDNENNFTESIVTKSLFDEEKSIIIKRPTDKILKIIGKNKKINNFFIKFADKGLNF